MCIYTSFYSMGHQSTYHTARSERSTAKPSAPPAPSTFGGSRYLDSRTLALYDDAEAARASSVAPPSTARANPSGSGTYYRPHQTRPRSVPSRSSRSTQSRSYASTMHDDPSRVVRKEIDYQYNVEIWTLADGRVVEVPLDAHTPSVVGVASEPPAKARKKPSKGFFTEAGQAYFEVGQDFKSAMTDIARALF